MEIPVAILEAIDPPRQVRSRGLPDGVIAITYMLEEENDGTRVTVTMSGFEKLPADARQDRIAPSGNAVLYVISSNASASGTWKPKPPGWVLFPRLRAFSSWIS